MKKYFLILMLSVIGSGKVGAQITDQDKDDMKKAIMQGFNSFQGESNVNISHRDAAEKECKSLSFDNQIDTIKKYATDNERDLFLKFLKEWKDNAEKTMSIYNIALDSVQNKMNRHNSMVKQSYNLNDEKFNKTEKELFYYLVKSNKDYSEIVLMFAKFLDELGKAEEARIQKEYNNLVTNFYVNVKTK